MVTSKKTKTAAAGAAKAGKAAAKAVTSTAKGMKVIKRVDQRNRDGSITRGKSTVVTLLPSSVQEAFGESKKSSTSKFARGGRVNTKRK